MVTGCYYLNEMQAACSLIRSAEASAILSSRLSSTFQIVRHISTKTHYQILGVSSTASQEQIRHAFLELSKQLHPDVNKHDKKTHDKFVQLNEAYTILSKQTVRDQYDRSLITRAYDHQHPSSPYYSSYHSPNWMKYRQWENTQQSYDEYGERVHWDETINPKGNPQNNQGYSNDNFYGVKGFKKLPNWCIVLSCVGVMIIGAALHYLTFSVTRRLHLNHKESHDRKLSAIYQSARDNAKLNGNELQLEILSSRLKGKKEIDDFSTTFK